MGKLSLTKEDVARVVQMAASHWKLPVQPTSSLGVKGGTWELTGLQGDLHGEFKIGDPPVVFKLRLQVSPQQVEMDF